MEDVFFIFSRGSAEKGAVPVPLISPLIQLNEKGGSGQLGHEALPGGAGGTHAEFSGGGVRPLSLPHPVGQPPKCMFQVVGT